jgi:hypothetical protein
MREKWDEVHFADGATYGVRTVERAIAATDEFYDGDGGWRLFDESPTAVDTASPTATADNESPRSGEETVAADVVVTLRERLEELEAENDRLREELSAERDRRRALEAAHDTDDDDGVFSALFSR